MFCKAPDMKLIHYNFTEIPSRKDILFPVKLLQTYTCTHTVRISSFSPSVTPVYNLCIRIGKLLTVCLIHILIFLRQHLCYIASVITLYSSDGNKINASLFVFIFQRNDSRRKFPAYTIQLQHTLLFIWKVNRKLYTSDYFCDSECQGISRLNIKQLL